MGYTIQRTDGTRDGLGDSVVFATEEAAWDAARTAFGRDPASEEGGVESWLEVVESDDGVTDADVEALRTEAAEAGDGRQVAICEAALATVGRSVDAYEQCERVIRDARANARS